MLRHARGFVAFALLLTVPAAAQVAEGGNTRLMGLSLDGAGGGLASLDTAAFFELGEVSSGELSSPGYRASIGFLAAHDPQVTNGPVVFGIEPAFGPAAGGTPISITGMNFDKFGLGGVGVSIGGHAAGGVVVQSASLITLLSPAGVSGPADVVVNDSIGSDTRPGGFLYTPAITTTPIVPLGGVLDIRNYGPPGNAFLTIISLTAWSAHTKFGTMLVGPDFFQIFSPTPYPAPDGVSSVPVAVPFEPALVGITVHFQSLSLTNVAPMQGSFTNASTVSIP